MEFDKSARGAFSTSGRVKACIDSHNDVSDSDHVQGGRSAAYGSQTKIVEPWDSVHGELPPTGMVF